MAKKYGVPFPPFFLLVLVALTARLNRAALLQGCDFGDELCDPGEVCIPDGLFGQCYSDAEATLVRPLILDRALNDAQSEVLRTELGRLAKDGLDWPHARSQCVLAYFKLAVSFQLDYDQDFCSAQDPANIWALVQRVQNALLSEEDQAEEEEGRGGGGEDEGQSLLAGGQQADDDGEEGEEAGQPEEEEEVELIPVLLLEPAEEEQPSYEMAANAVPHKNNQTTGAEKKRNAPESVGGGGGLGPKEQTQLDELVHKMLANRRPSGETEAAVGGAHLSDKQLARLVQFVRQLQKLLQENILERAEEASEQLEKLELEQPEEEEEESTQGGSEEEADPIDVSNNPVLLLKKDSEQFDYADMGLAHTVHKIVKGGIQRVEGNRVYLQVEKENLTEEELYKLIAYLDRKIAAPNRLYFDQFLYQDGQLSFRISRPSSPDAKTMKLPQLGSASGVAQAVYKRRKDIQTLAGVRVDETGIGSGKDVVPVERSQRDQLFLPILAVCGLTICALLSVLAASLISRRRRKTSGATLLPQTIDQTADGKVYEQLCRQRAQECPQAVAVIEAGGQRSKHSSTSSWSGDETGPAASNLDIGTGHVLLTFLQKHLEQPEEMAKQWESVRDYTAQEAQIVAAKKAENLAKNVDPAILPYDDSRVILHENELIEFGGDGSYVNASKIYDSNPEHPAYIAAQAPLDATVAQFWQMIWEQGIGLVVNLCNQEEAAIYCKYWPEEGSKVFGSFEVHLVSEHIWSEHYVVRSLYLKNTSTQETRTVTQFHFLSWPSAGVPGSSKALLEFRRKVNKSYRGRASPVLVHCTNGGGRTGTYILIDMTTNRIQRGVKELNIAASLEHLRDQRMGMVENEKQFKCAFSCVADEVSSLLKGLQH